VHLTASPVDWYAARAAGIAAYILLTGVVGLGLALAARAPGSRWPRWPAFAVEDIHRVGGLLVGSFIAIHIATIAIDSFLPFAPLQLVVPLTAGYRPIWTGLGIAAAELLLALAVTNHYRGRLRHALWRRNAPLMIAVYALATAIILALTTWRIAQRHPRVPFRRSTALTAGAACALIVTALLIGPLSPHNRPFNATTFNDTLTGRILQQAGATKAIVSMAGNGTGRQNVLVRADLLIEANGLQATSFQLEFLPSGTICNGTVNHVQQLGFDGTCHLPDHSHRAVHAHWQLIHGPDLRGTITATTN